GCGEEKKAGRWPRLSSRICQKPLLTGLGCYQSISLQQLVRLLTACPRTWVSLPMVACGVLMLRRTMSCQVNTLAPLLSGITDCGDQDFPGDYLSRGLCRLGMVRDDRRKQDHTSPHPSECGVRILQGGAFAHKG